MASFFKRLFGSKKKIAPISDDVVSNIVMPEPKEMPETEASTIPPRKEPRATVAYEYPTIELLDEALQHIFTSLRQAEATLPLIWSVNSTGIQVRDLTELQSLFIHGTPGSGKSNLLHQFLLTLLYKKHPSQLKLVLVDHKGLDLRLYRLLEDQFLAKLPYADEAVGSTLHQVMPQLDALSIEMDNRYELMRLAGVRNIKEYQAKFVNRLLKGDQGHQFLPFLVLVIDNVDGYTITAGKEITSVLQRLLTDGYRAGIYCILTTTETSAQALPGAMYDVVAERIAFRMNSKEEYKKVFGTTQVVPPHVPGAFHYLYLNKVLQGQSVLFSHDCLDRVVEFIGKQVISAEGFLLPNPEEPIEEVDWMNLDALFEDAARLIVQNQIGSTSLLQRRMKLGYNRAGRLMDQLEAAGIVGENRGSEAREVLIKTEWELQQHLDALR